MFLLKIQTKEGEGKTTATEATERKIPWTLRPYYEPFSGHPIEVG